MLVAVFGDIYNIAARLKAIDDRMALFFNTENDHYEIYLVKGSTRPDGRPRLVIRVMNEDGSPRVPDDRELQTLMQFRDPDNAQEAYDAADRRQMKADDDYDKKLGDIAQATAEDFKFFGTDVVPSTRWRDRTDVPRQLAAAQQIKEKQ